MAVKLGQITTKEQLLSHLQTQRIAAIYDIFGQALLLKTIQNWKQGEEPPETLITILPEVSGPVSFKRWAESLGGVNGQVLGEASQWANRNLTANYLTKVFRLTESFYKEKGEIKYFRNQDWHQFVRVHVNSMSHDWKYHFDHYAKRKMTDGSLEYKGVRVGMELEGKSVSVKLEIVLSLADDIIDFVDQDS